MLETYRVDRCKNCNNIILKRVIGKSSDFCNRKCYYQWYYSQHKQEIDDRRKQWYRQHYVPHPLPRKYKTKEEYMQSKKEYGRKYYETHKEYYRQKNKEWYEKHRNDPELKRKQAIAMKKYNKKKVSKNNETI